MARTGKMVFLALIALLSAGCQTMPVPLSKFEREGGLCQQDPVVLEKLNRLTVGMCEEDVFNVLGISHDTPNLNNLDTTTLFQHVSLLGERSEPVSSCIVSHDAEVPYVGHRVLCTRLSNTGYLKGIKWAQRTTGEDSYVDFLFKDGVFISFSKGGVINRDNTELAYPWESILGDPFGTLNGSIVP